MRKNFVLVLAALLVCVGLVGCGQDKDHGEKAGKENKTAVKQEDQFEDLAKRLGENGFLQKEITDQMTELKKEKSEENSGEMIYVATPTKEAVAEEMKLDESNDWPGSIHNIQYSVKDGKLTYYHYKNYAYKLKEKAKAISKEEAPKLVKAFAKEFIENGDQLKFENHKGKQNSSLYDPGVVETWYAQKDNFEYHIVVDFREGNIVYFSCDEIK